MGSGTKGRHVKTRAELVQLRNTRESSLFFNYRVSFLKRKLPPWAKLNAKNKEMGKGGGD